MIGVSEKIQGWPKLQAAPGMDVWANSVGVFWPLAREWTTGHGWWWTLEIILKRNFCIRLVLCGVKA